MPTYRELLEATIAHLERLQDQGVRYVKVPAALLAELTTVRPKVKEPIRPSRPITARVTPPSTPTSLAPKPTASPAPLPASVAARWSSATVSAPKSTVPAPPSAPLPPKLDPVAQAAALEEVRRRALACVKCPHLAASRKSVVFGVGDSQARLMFVGEAPGADEDEQGEPFVGKAGELLTRIIGTMGLTRSQVFITNVLKCRPDTPGQTAGNRKPTTDEMATCRPWLQEQIDLIQPEVMVALGATAMEGLLGKTVGISRLRGTWQQYRGIPLMPTYHPAYLLRNQALTEKRKVWEDMLAVMERLQMPISKKQRGYFLTQ